MKRPLWAVLLLAFGCTGRPEAVVSVRIPRGIPTAAIAETLRCYGIIDNPVKFRIEAVVLGLDKRLRHGIYQLRTNSEELAVLRKLTSKGQTSVRVTIPEGYGLLQTADLLDRMGVCEAPEFLAACQDSALLDSLGIPGASAEGYLFPDTYELDLESAPRLIVRRTAERFFQVYSTEKRDVLPPLDDRQTVILASIVEREAVLPEEFPVIAGVFVNRLDRGMPLQSCATVQYALPGHREQLTYEDTHVQSPYNTYIHPGLPPGPICNPGRAALKAALSPATTQYLYFVSKGDGSHAFSQTWREHQKARRRTPEAGRKTH